MAALNFFYSYCHSDVTQRESLEKHLAMLVRNGIIKQWHDGQIIAGNEWKPEIIDNLKSADIVIFLVTSNWLDSEACIEEWDKAKELAKDQPNKRLIPIIASECSWLDFDDMRHKLALPKDGKPVSKWESQDSAWLDVYNGIKKAAEDVKKNFKLKASFKGDLNRIEFCSNSVSEIFLEDVFVFPNLSIYSERTAGVELSVDNISQLMGNKLQFILGDSQSGKTKLCSWVYLQYVQKDKFCIYIDLAKIGNGKNRKQILEDEFNKQLTGDFETWFSSNDKTILIDNLAKENYHIDFIKFTEEYFDNVLVCTSTDIFRSFYIDDERFTDYKEININPFCHGKQEQLIKNWLNIKSTGEDINHNLIDTIETNINAIIIDNKVLPRLPFFILSILQTYESFMPENLKITAYGHCYQALIVARLLKSGINQEDSALESAFTFCSSLAYKIFESNNGLFISESDFEDFKVEYEGEYIIKKSVFNRLFSEQGLLINTKGKIEFSMSYSYYFFLGKYLTENYVENKEKISAMVESSFARHNSLTLIFTIHHANDINILDEILTHTMCAIDDKLPAKLTKEETQFYKDVLEEASLPKPTEIKQEVEVDAERTKERELRTKREFSSNNDDLEIERLATENDSLNQLFRCNKNIEILSQILKNKTGSLKKPKLTEIVEIICDAGLRMASIMLADEKEINACVNYVYEQYKKSNDYDATKKTSYHLNQIKKTVQFRGLIWVLSSIEKSVKAINKPELRGIISEITKEKSTPAYDLIKYFYLLDTSNEFDEHLKLELENMVHNYPEVKNVFLNRIVAIRTSHYEKTHNVKEKYRQSIFASLGLQYKKPKTPAMKKLDPSKTINK